MASALITPHGANVLSWCTSNGVERLFLSRTATIQSGHAIRGGVPIIFPQFGGPGLLRHGFARTIDWTLLDASDERACYRLSASEETLLRWPHSFQLQFEIRLLPERLSMILKVVNTGSDHFSFTGALHTYLRVTSLGEAYVPGLQDRSFFDEVTGKHLIDSAPALRFDGLIDRLYPNAAAQEIPIHTGFGDIHIVSEGFKDLVLWNPGPKAAASLVDLHPGGYQNFVCVESAMIQNPISLGPDEQWHGSQTLVLRDSLP